jgi:hypothetical protein
MKHNSDFKFDLFLGKITEGEVADIFSNSKIEVKDETAHSKRTGNVFIEFESRGKPSGIVKSKSDFYCFKTTEGSYIFVETKKLKKVFKDNYNKKGFVKGGDSNTSKGVLVPIIDLIY